MELAFKNLDKNNDGFLTYKEIKEADKNISFGLGDKWKDVLIKCDTDRNGKISFTEFEAAALQHRKLLTDDNIE